MIGCIWFSFVKRGAEKLLGTSIPPHLAENYSKAILVNSTIADDMVFPHELAHILTNLDHPVHGDLVNPNNPSVGIYYDPLKAGTKEEQNKQQVSLKYNILTQASLLEKLWNFTSVDIYQITLTKYQLSRVFACDYGFINVGKSQKV